MELAIGVWPHSSSAETSGQDVQDPRKCGMPEVQGRHTLQVQLRSLGRKRLQEEQDCCNEPVRLQAPLYPDGGIHLVPGKQTPM